MYSKLSKNYVPKRVLVISQTNIGDVVLSCPVIDVLRENFPQSKIDVVTGPKAISLFEDNPYFGFKLFDKRASLDKTISFFFELFKQHYDLVVDLRHTMIPVFLMPNYSTPIIRFPSLLQRGVRGVVHKKEIHLNSLRQAYDFNQTSSKRYAVTTLKQDENFFEREVEPFLQGNDFVVIAPGAADGAKRWEPEGFVAVADYLANTTKVVFVGDTNDAIIIQSIQVQMKFPSLSLGGKMNLRQLAFVLLKARFAITHDSGVMHLASYLNVPLLVLWGPTSLERYAPWSTKSMVVRRNEQCVRCQNPKSKEPHSCMSHIKAEDVIKALEKFKS